MGLNINGSWVDTRNGTVHFSTANDIDRVFFNNVKVWEKVRSLPDTTATHNSTISFSSYPDTMVAKGEGSHGGLSNLVESILNTEFGGPYYKESAELTQNSDYITFNLGADYVGATVTLSIKAVCTSVWSGAESRDVGVGWCTANGRAYENDPNYPLVQATATVDSSGNVTFQGRPSTYTKFLCACTDSQGNTLSESGSTILNQSPSGVFLYIYTDLRIQLDVVKDGMTASGYADFTGISLNDTISIPVRHTN